MENDVYTPTGELQGDDRPVPHRGATTGVLAGAHGQDLDANAVNRMRGISGGTGSDSAFSYASGSTLQFSGKANRPDDAQCGCLGDAR
jgi:hypothetical protein